MIETLFYVISRYTDPYYNQGLEKYLLDNVADNAAVLFLCQNENTVMIGKKQKAHEVCKVEDLAEANGNLARRLSGGPAVYQDQNCLNISLITDGENHNDKMLASIVQDACRQLDIETRICPEKGLQAVNGKIILLQNTYTHKLDFGNTHIVKHCDHGMLMLRNNLRTADRFIADRESLEQISAAAGLEGLCPGLGIDRMEAALLRAFVDAYDTGAEQLTLIPAASIRAAGGRFHDDSAISDRDFRYEIAFFGEPGWFLEEN